MADLSEKYNNENYCYPMYNYCIMIILSKGELKVGSSTRLGIRFKPLPGESLSGYLMRMATANGVDVKKLTNELKIKSLPKTVRDRTYLFDIYPQLLVDIGKLSEWMGQPNYILEKTTFSPVVKKLFSGEDIVMPKGTVRTNISTSIVKDRRRFCSQCLKEGRGYQLLWQVAEIEICDRHLTKLTSDCANCTTDQSYISENLSYYQCETGNHDLKNQSQESVAEAEVIDQLKKYDDWRFLLDPTSTFIPNIEGLNRNQCLAVLLLYITKTQKMPFSAKSRSILSHNDIYKYRNIISQPDECNLNADLDHLLKIIRKSGMTVKEVAAINIPHDFLISCMDLSNDKSTPVCLAPWCCSYRKNHNLIKVLNAPRVTHDGKVYNSHSVCTACWMEYGVDAHDKTWKSIGNLVEMTNQTRSLLNQKQPKREISRRLGTSRMTVNKIVGYLCRNGLLIEDMNHEHGPTRSLEDGLVKWFQTFVKEEGRGGMLVNARQLLGWDTRTFYYYLAEPAVQQYLIFDAHLDRETRQKVGMKRRVYDKSELQQKVIDEIELFLADDRDVTKKAIAKSLNVSINTLSSFGFDDTIQKAAKEQRDKRKNAEENHLLELCRQYIEEKQYENEPFEAQDVSAFLGLSYSNLWSKYPKLREYISSRAKADKEKRRLEKIEEYKAIVDMAVSELCQNGEKITNDAIAGYLNETYKNLFMTYPEIVAHIKVVKANLHEIMIAERV